VSYSCEVEGVGREERNTGGMAEGAVSTTKAGYVRWQSRRGSHELTTNLIVVGRQYDSRLNPPA